MTFYNEVLPEFQHHDAQLLGISVDGVWCHLAFSKDRKLRFPLLSDFEPKGEVASLTVMESFVGAMFPQLDSIQEPKEF
jgi:peroxiredoxin